MLPIHPIFTRRMVYNLKVLVSTIKIKTTLTSRLTVVSREAKKKQHARASSGLRDHYSELFTRMAALKFYQDSR